MKLYNKHDLLKPLFALGIIGIVLLMICTPVFANNAPDDEQQIAINADSFHFDNQTGIATYTDNVVATQGSRRLTGDRLEIYRNAQTGKIEKLIVYGKPAHYQGLTSPDKPLLFAHAQIITYVIATKYLTLTGEAEVTQDGDVYRAAQIEYDGVKETVYSPPTEKRQTTIILKNRTSKEDAGT